MEAEENERNGMMVRREEGYYADMKSYKQWKETVQWVVVELE